MGKVIAVYTSYAANDTIDGQINYAPNHQLLVNGKRLPVSSQQGPTCWYKCLQMISQCYQLDRSSSPLTYVVEKYNRLLDAHEQIKTLLLDVGTRGIHLLSMERSSEQIAAFLIRAPIHVNKHIILTNLPLLRKLASEVYSLINDSTEQQQTNNNSLIEYVFAKNCYSVSLGAYKNFLENRPVIEIDANKSWSEKAKTFDNLGLQMHFQIMEQYQEQIVGMKKDAATKKNKTEWLAMFREHNLVFAGGAFGVHAFSSNATEVITLGHIEANVLKDEDYLGKENSDPHAIIIMGVVTHNDIDYLAFYDPNTELCSTTCKVQLISIALFNKQVLGLYVCQAPLALNLQDLKADRHPDLNQVNIYIDGKLDNSEIRQHGLQIIPYVEPENYLPTDFDCVKKYLINIFAPKQEISSSGGNDLLSFTHFKPFDIDIYGTQQCTDTLLEGLQHCTNLFQLNGIIDSAFAKKTEHQMFNEHPFMRKIIPALEGVLNNVNSLSGFEKRYLQELIQSLTKQYGKRNMPLIDFRQFDFRASLVDEAVVRNNLFNNTHLYQLTISRHSQALRLELSENTNTGSNIITNEQSIAQLK